MDATARRLILAATTLLAGCGGAVHGTPSQLVHRAPQRTFAAGSADLHERVPGLTREGEVELGGDRARIVEHGRYGYREYRYLGGAWFQAGGDIGSFGEDLGGKWVRHPRRGSPDDVLADLTGMVRSLTRATGVRSVGKGRYRALVGGDRVDIRLDGHGRVVELRGGQTLVVLSHFGRKVQVEAPPADELYVGHD